MTELDPSQSKLLGAQTLTALKHLGENTLVIDEDDNACPGWRMARIGDVALLEKQADHAAARRSKSNGCPLCSQRRLKTIFAGSSLPPALRSTIH